MVCHQVLMANELEVIPTASSNTIHVEHASQITNKQLSVLLIKAKELQVLSQIIAKDYFYIHQLVREEEAKLEIKQSIKDLEHVLHILNSRINDQEIKNLLSYLGDVSVEYKEIIEQPFSMNNGSQVLDYSETMFEGARSIIRFLEKYTKESNHIFDVVFQQQLILQRISKFYIAFQAGFNDKIIVGQLKKSVKQFELGIKEISTYKFSDQLQKEVSRIEKYWPLSKKFYLGMEKGDLTLIVFISTDHMMSSLNKILTLFVTIQHVFLISDKIR